MEGEEKERGCGRTGVTTGRERESGSECNLIYKDKVTAVVEESYQVLKGMIM